MLSLVVSAIHCTKIRVLMAPIQRLRYRTVLSAELVGVLVDTIFPLRLNELVRAFVIGKSEGLRPSKILGVQVVEKAVELPLLAALILSLGLAHPLPAWALSAVYVGLAATAGMVLTLLLAVVWPALLEAPIQWLGGLNLPGAGTASRLLAQILEGMRLGATRPAAVGLILLITLVEWAVMASSLWLAAAAIGVRLDGWMTLCLLVVNFVAFAMPSKTSGAVGIYEFTGKTMMMALFGMQADQALAVVMLAHGTLLGFGVLGGLAGLVMAQVTLAEVRQQLKQAGREPPRSEV